MLIECEQGGGMCPGRIVIYNINDLYTKSIKKQQNASKYIKNGIQHIVEKVIILALGGQFKCDDIGHSYVEGGGLTIHPFPYQ